MYSTEVAMIFLRSVTCNLETDMSKAISEILDIDHVETYSPPAVIMEESIDSDGDIGFARSNLKQLMTTVSEAIKEAMEVAIESESPRAFEVVTGMIAAAGDLNSKLIASHQIQQKMKIESGSLKQPTSVTNNSIVFTGTPAELSKLMKEKRNE